MPYAEWTYCDNMLGVKIARWSAVRGVDLEYAISGGYRRYDNCLCRSRMLIANADSDADSYACWWLFFKFTVADADSDADC